MGLYRLASNDCFRYVVAWGSPFEADVNLVDEVLCDKRF